MSPPSFPIHRKSAPIPLRKILESSFPAAFVTAVVALVIVLRDTRYFTQPRFWAEEGTLHFAFSFSHPWWQALFQPQVGYLNFWPNLSTLLATLPPLEMAPLVTTIMALVVQMIPIVLILWSKSPLWSGWKYKLLGIGVVLFAPLTSEVWLNTVNSFTYFAVIAFFILLEEPLLGQARRWVYRALLLLSGLSGTLACFLIPLYAFRAFTEKDRERWVQTAVLSACAVVQSALIFSYKTSGSFEQRLHLIGFTTLGATIWTQTIGFFAVGLTQAHEWAITLYSLAVNDLSSFQDWGRGLLVVGLLLLFLLSTNLPLKYRILFLGGYGILMLLPMMFSVIDEKYDLMRTGVHGRLFLAPNVIFGWMLLFGVRFQKWKNWRVSLSWLASLGCVALLATSLFWGITSYRAPWYVADTWPDWKTEVQHWRADPSYPLRIQPEGWVVSLPQR